MRRVSSALLVFVTVLITYSYFRNVRPSVNALSRFALVRALIEDHTTRIDRFHRLAGDDKAYRDGHYYSDKAPGTSFLAAPTYALYFAWLKWTVGEERARQLSDEESRSALYVCTLTAVTLPSALTILLFFRIAAQLREETAALFATTSLGLASLAFPYSTIFFSHQLTGATLFAAFGTLWLERRRAATQPGGFRTARVALAGLLAGYAVLTEYTSIVPAALVGLYLLWIAPARRLITSYVLGMLPPLVLLMAYDWISFGSPLSFGYSFVPRPEFAEGVSRGVFGFTYPKLSVLASILFGSYRGLLLLNPILVLSVVGFRRMWERRDLRPEALLGASITVAYLLLSASYVFWDGGASLGPRYAVPMLPFLALPMVFVMKEQPSLNVGTTVAVLLFVVSTAQMLISTAVYPLVPSVYDDSLGYVYFRFFDPKAAASWSRMNWGAALGLHGQASLLPLLGIWVAASVLFLRKGRMRWRPLQAVPPRS